MEWINQNLPWTPWEAAIVRGGEIELAASVFHFGILSIEKIKEYLDVKALEIQHHAKEGAP